jgi:hypothetical protein
MRLPRRGERREEVATRRTRTARAAARRGEGENGARATRDETLAHHTPSSGGPGHSGLRGREERGAGAARGAGVGMGPRKRSCSKCSSFTSLTIAELAVEEIGNPGPVGRHCALTIDKSGRGAARACAALRAQRARRAAPWRPCAAQKGLLRRARGAWRRACAGGGLAAPQPAGRSGLPSRLGAEALLRGAALAAHAAQLAAPHDRAKLPNWSASSAAQEGCRPACR